MKKQVLRIAVIMALPFLFSVQSCKKEENTSTAELGSAVISGKISGYVNLLSGKKDPIEGIKVIVKVNTSDLVTSGTVPANSARIFEGVTNADGIYTIKIDAGNKPMNVTVDFPATLNIEQTLENGTKQTVPYTNSSAVRNITIYKGQTKNENAEYVFVRESSEGKITIKGIAKYFYEPCAYSSTDYEDRWKNVNNQTLLVTWESDGSSTIDREMEVKVSNGKFEFTINTTEASKQVYVRGMQFFEEIKDEDLDSPGDCKKYPDYEYWVGMQSITVNKGEVGTIEVLYH